LVYGGNALIVHNLLVESSYYCFVLFCHFLTIHSD
jgi:hypothetical protein